MRKIYYLSLIVLCFSSCQKKENKNFKVEKAFYYWASNSLFPDETTQNLKKLGVHKLYVKLFEVDYNEVQGNFPFEKNRLSTYETNRLDSVKIVPTIFIKNGIFQFNNYNSLDKLADNIVFLIDKYHKEEYQEGKVVFEYDEIQIDCDWTKSTKEKYFYLLKKIKSLSGKQISCTLRLYPYKYPEIIGFPPVDKAMLMCYNLIKPLTNKELNSILDINELKKYLNERRKYPIHLDVALPVFYWSQLYQNNHFVKLIPITKKDMGAFAKELKPMWYMAQKDTSINYATYIKEGDQIKCESISLATLQEAIRIIKEKVVLEEGTTISLFDLNQGTFKQFSDEEFSGLYNSFSK